MVHLAFEVGVQERAVTFAPSPKNVTRSLERVRNLNRLLYLGARVRENVRVAACGGAVRETGMGKQTRGAPKQSHPGALLLFLARFDDDIQVPTALPQIAPFRSDVPVV